MAIDAFKNLPDINFVDKDIETLLRDMISEYEQAYYDATGENKTLAEGDPIRIWIYAQALRLYGAYQLIDYSAKQNLLKYSAGNILDHLGARVGVTRLPSSYAVATQKFTLSAIQSNPVAIPEGTRVSVGSIFFVTTEYAEIPAGDLSVETEVKCLESGTVGNGFTPGEINTLVDPIPFVESTENTDTSQGGADTESDESFRERIFLRPESFSTAGPREAYIYFVKEYSSNIADVSVASPSPGVVDIRFILQNGELPDTGIINSVLDYISEDKRRPLTDNVTADAPEVVNYDINITYYIKTSDGSFASNIQAAVDQAVAEYQLWQKTKIGRDVNPSELIHRVLEAGAKRAEVTAPVFTALTDTQVAKALNVTVNYGGLEDE